MPHQALRHSARDTLSCDPHCAAEPRLGVYLGRAAPLADTAAPVRSQPQQHAHVRGAVPSGHGRCARNIGCVNVTALHLLCRAGLRHRGNRRRRRVPRRRRKAGAAPWRPCSRCGAARIVRRVAAGPHSLHASRKPLHLAYGAETTPSRARCAPRVVTTESSTARSAALSAAVQIGAPSSLRPRRISPKGAAG